MGDRGVDVGGDGGGIPIDMVVVQYLYWGRIASSVVDIFCVVMCGNVGDRIIASSLKHSYSYLKVCTFLTSVDQRKPGMLPSQVTQLSV